MKQNLVSRKLKYLEFDIMKYSSFLNRVFRKRHFIAENWLCFRACNSRIVTYDQEFCHVVWFFVFSITITESFLWKVFLKKTLSWRCRKHVFVFEIVSLKDLDKFMIKLSFSFNCWVKDLFATMEESFEDSSILGIDFWVKPLERS